jgi:hypothetical protein
MPGHFCILALQVQFYNEYIFFKAEIPVLQNAGYVQTPVSYLNVDICKGIGSIISIHYITREWIRPAFLPFMI